MLFPEPAKNADSGQRSNGEEREAHTFAVDPQERASGLPFRKDTALRKPLGRSPMMDVSCNVMIFRWICWCYPSSKALSQLVPCEQVRDARASGERIDHKHFTSSRTAFASFPSKQCLCDQDGALSS